MKASPVRIAASLLLFAACSRPSSDVSLTIRQVAWPGEKAVQVVVKEQELDVTASAGRKVIDHVVVRVSEAQSDEVRRLFWKSWKHQPSARHVPRVLDGLVIEQLWEGPERAWRVSTRGPLTPYEYEALNYLNPLLPPPYRFPLRLGFRHRD